MSALSADGEPPRKRIRKGTKSCWECKRRKVKCQLSTEDVPVCAGCLTRGTTCLSQEYPEERDPSSGTNVGERLGRIEQVLEKLLAKMERYEEEDNPKILTPDSASNNDVLTPYSGMTHDNSGPDAPFMHLFDNPLIGRGASSPPASTPATQTTMAKTPSSVTTPKLERIRQALLELLPTQREVNMICDASSSWLLIYALTERNPHSVTSSIFNLAELAKEHPTRIAGAVLYIAVCMQQLDPHFDTSQLRIFPTIEARMEKCINVVQALITSDDELVSTVVGLECLLLQGIFHTNAGNPRRAWLTFRRALSLGQLMGIHKRECTMKGGKDMWLEMTQADRYLVVPLGSSTHFFADRLKALLLGLPAAADDIELDPDENFENPDVDKERLFIKTLCGISGRIIQRNQAKASQAYATTQEIDESLERLAKAMPVGYWDIPEIMPSDRSSKAAATFNKMMIQIWFFQIEALTHLPFMLRASTERRFEYSKFSCLKASREVMSRYLALRKAENKAFCCKVVDFGALTASVTLFLGLLDPVSGTETQEEKNQRESDKQLVQTVLVSMEELANRGKDVVATQSVNVIKSLLAVDDSSGTNTGNLKLTIPYFGTISIIRPARPPTPILPPPQQHQQQHQQHPISLGQQLPSQTWGNYLLPSRSPSAMPVNHPMVSFQSAQFPVLPDGQSIHEWALPEADTLFFDSLLNTDLEGNWLF